MSTWSFIERHKTVAAVSTVALLLVVTIVSYIWWSVASWAVLEDHSRNLLQSTTTHFNNALVMPTRTSDEKTKKVAALVAINQEITSNQRVCDTPGIISWQRNVLDAFKKHEDECRADILRLNGFNAKLDDITNYLHDNRILAGFVTVASGQQSEYDEASWQGVADKWRVLGAKLREMKVSGRFEPILRRAITEVDHVHVCWVEVVDASTAKDRDRFEKAKDELSKAYGSFKDITQLDNTTITSLIERLSASKLD